MFGLNSTVLIMCFKKNKADFWNVNCARTTAIIFDTRTDILVKMSKFLRHEMSRPEGTRTLQPSDSCQMFEPFELSGPDICCPMLSNTGFGGIDIFEVQLTLEMLTVREQQHSFSTYERMFFFVPKFWDRKCLDLRGARTPKLRIHAECSKPFELSGPDIYCPMLLNTGSGGIDSFNGHSLLWHMLSWKCTKYIHLCD